MKQTEPGTGIQSWPSSPVADAALQCAFCAESPHSPQLRPLITRPRRVVTTMAAPLVTAHVTRRPCCVVAGCRWICGLQNIAAATAACRRSTAIDHRAPRRCLLLYVPASARAGASIGVEFMSSLFLVFVQSGFHRLTSTVPTPAPWSAVVRVRRISNPWVRTPRRSRAAATARGPRHPRLCRRPGRPTRCSQAYEDPPRWPAGSTSWKCLPEIRTERILVGASYLLDLALMIPPGCLFDLLTRWAHLFTYTVPMACHRVKKAASLCEAGCCSCLDVCSDTWPGA